VIVTFPRREVAIAPHVTHHEALHVTPHVRRLVAALQGETGRAELMAALGVADGSRFLRTYLHASLDAGLIEMTVPQSPRSRIQRHWLTVLGREGRHSQQESEEEGITERAGRPLPHLFAHHAIVVRIQHLEIDQIHQLRHAQRRHCLAVWLTS
jgi:ATP-dependent DNA helicase RecG